MNTTSHVKTCEPISHMPFLKNLHKNSKFFSEKKIESNTLCSLPGAFSEATNLIISTKNLAKAPEGALLTLLSSLAKAKQLELSYCGVHLGHQSLKFKSAWHSSISQFLIGSRNNSAIIKLNNTLKYLVKALYIVTLIIKSGGHILIINTNPEYSKLLQQLKKNTQSSKICYSDCHWVGGILTNWSQIHKSINTFTNFYQKFDSFLLKNNINFPRYKKMKKSFKGFINLSSQQNKQLNQSYKNNLVLKTKWKPDLIFILDSKSTGAIIKEASKLQIPIIALIDSNTNIADITYPIPTNTNSFIFVWFCLEYITKITNKLILSKTNINYKT